MQKKTGNNPIGLFPAMKILYYLLIETCPVILDIRFQHHHRKNHLSAVVVDLSGGVLCVILSVEGSGVAGINLEYIRTDGTSDRSADCAFRSHGSGTYELRVKSLTSHRGEPYIYTCADG